MAGCIIAEVQADRWKSQLVFSATIMASESTPEREITKCGSTGLSREFWMEVEVRQISCWRTPALGRARFMILQGEFTSDTKRDDQGHGSVPGGARVPCPPPKKSVIGVCGRSRVVEQSARLPLWAIDLCALALLDQSGDSVGYHQFSEGLCCIDVKVSCVFFEDRGDFLNRLDDARFVVCMHDSTPARCRLAKQRGPFAFNPSVAIWREHFDI